MRGLEFFTVFRSGPAFWSSHFLFTRFLNTRVCSREVFKRRNYEFTEGSTDSLCLLMSGCGGKWIAPRSHTNIQSGGLSCASHDAPGLEVMFVLSMDVIYILNSDWAVIFSQCHCSSFYSNVFFPSLTSWLMLYAFTLYMRDLVSHRGQHSSRALLLTAAASGCVSRLCPDL